MRSWLKRIGVLILILFVAMQFYRPAKDGNDTTAKLMSMDSMHDIPTSVKNILQQSCYDCHSNQTKYPWYANLQPMRYVMDKHIIEARAELNFDEWGAYSTRKQASKLDGMMKQIEKNEMPLASYTLIHGEATLSETEKKELIDWINTIKIKYE